MARRAQTMERMDRQVDHLIADFVHFVKIFDQPPARFTGPSVYFHYRTLERLRAHKSPSAA